jgi:hypothetical protein
MVETLEEEETTAATSVETSSEVVPENVQAKASDPSSDVVVEAKPVESVATLVRELISKVGSAVAHTGDSDCTPKLLLAVEDTPRLPEKETGTPNSAGASLSDLASVITSVQKAVEKVVRKLELYADEAGHAEDVNDEFHMVWQDIEPVRPPVSSSELMGGPPSRRHAEDGTDVRMLMGMSPVELHLGDCIERLHCRSVGIACPVYDNWLTARGMCWLTPTHYRQYMQILNGERSALQNAGSHLKELTECWDTLCASVLRHVLTPVSIRLISR